MMNRPNSVQKSIVRAISLYAGRISFNAGQISLYAGQISFNAGTHIRLWVRA